MKTKILKRSSKCSFLVYAVFTCVLCVVECQAEESEAPSPVEITEQVVRALLDPFLSRLPVEEPVVKPEPVVVNNNNQSGYNAQKQIEDMLTMTRLDPPIAEPYKDIVPEQTIQLPVFPELRLAGIVYNTSRPQVILNNKVLDVGQSVDNVQVAEIDKGHVRLIFDNRHFIMGIDTSPEEVR